MARTALTMYIYNCADHVSAHVESLGATVFDFRSCETTPYIDESHSHTTRARIPYTNSRLSYRERDRIVQLSITPVSVTCVHDR